VKATTPRINKTRESFSTMPVEIVCLFCDLLESADVRNLAAATGARWMTESVVRRRELFDAIQAGSEQRIRQNFLAPTQKIERKSLIRLAIEVPSLTALRTLVHLGAEYTAADVHVAEGLRDPYRRLVLRALLAI
jgi:hypothetical protein